MNLEPWVTWTWMSLRDFSTLAQPTISFFSFLPLSLSFSSKHSFDSHTQSLCSWQGWMSYSTFALKSFERQETWLGRRSRDEDEEAKGGKERAKRKKDKEEALSWLRAIFLLLLVLLSFLSPVSVDVKGRDLLYTRQESIEFQLTLLTRLRERENKNRKEGITKRTKKYPVSRRWKVLNREWMNGWLWTLKMSCLAS